MKDFSSKQTFIGISLGNQSTNDTGVAVLDRNLKIITLDKLFTADDITFFLDNLACKDDALIVVSMADNATLLSNRWKLFSKRYQLVQTTGNVKNVEGWQNRFSSRCSEYFYNLSCSGYDIYRFETADIKMKLRLGGMFKSRSTYECKFLQNVLRTQYNMSELPSNMIPASQLEAILGAILARKIAEGNETEVLFNYKGLNVLSLSSK